MSALSRRQRQVHELVRAGKQNKEIAAELGISPRTVEMHRYRLQAKLSNGACDHMWSFSETPRPGWRCLLCGQRRSCVGVSQ